MAIADEEFGWLPLGTLVAAEIRAQLGLLDLTQKDLAELCFQGQPWVSRRLSGEVQMTVNDLDTMAIQLNTTALELIERATSRLQRSMAKLERRGLQPSDGKVASSPARRVLTPVPSPRSVTLQPHSPRPLLRALPSTDTCNG